MKVHYDDAIELVVDLIENNRKYPTTLCILPKHKN